MSMHGENEYSAVLMLWYSAVGQQGHDTIQVVLTKTRKVAGGFSWSLTDLRQAGMGPHILTCVLSQYVLFYLELIL